jgi:hypothetical protein
VPPRCGCRSQTYSLTRQHPRDPCGEAIPPLNDGKNRMHHLGTNPPSTDYVYRGVLCSSAPLRLAPVPDIRDRRLSEAAARTRECCRIRNTGDQLRKICVGICAGVARKAHRSEKRNISCFCALAEHSTAVGSCSLWRAFLNDHLKIPGRRTQGK